MSWRNLKLNQTLPIEGEVEVVYLAGFDYESLKYSFSEYLSQNIYVPLKFLSNILGSRVKIIYINTKIEKRKYTFSRYYFCKFLLGNKLDMMHENFKNVSIATIIDKNNKPLIFGSKFTKAIFMIMIKLKLIKTTSLDEVKKILNEESEVKYDEHLKLIFQNLKKYFFGQVVEIFSWIKLLL